jgi:hypothetical protein
MAMLCGGGLATGLGVLAAGLGLATGLMRGLRLLTALAAAAAAALMPELMFFGSGILEGCCIVSIWGLRQTRFHAYLATRVRLQFLFQNIGPDWFGQVANTCQSRYSYRGYPENL